MPKRKFDRNDPNITARYSSGDYPLSSETFIRKIPGSQPWYLPDDTETVVINYSTPDRQYYQGNTPVEADTVRTRYTHNPYPFFRSTQLVGNTTHTSPVMRQTVKPMPQYKFQQGGQLNMDEQQLQLAFIQYLAQKLGVTSQEELEAAIQQMGEEGLRQAYAEFMQVMQQQQVQRAQFGAKLNYLKMLRGQCPEGYEMQYFKLGGTVCQKCMKKQVGGEVETTNDPVKNFKQVRAAKCGKKMKKAEQGLPLEKCGGKTKKKACGGLVKKDQKGAPVKPQRTVSGVRTNNDDPDNGVWRSTIQWNDGTRSRMEADEGGTVYYGRRGEVGITNVPNARQNAIADSLYRADGWGMRNPKTYPLQPKKKRK